MFHKKILIILFADDHVARAKIEESPQRDAHKLAK
jgi:hypothetical protein